MDYVLRVAPNRIPHLRNTTLPTPARAMAYRELLSICEAILADGVVNVEEVGFLKTWIQRHPEEHNEWPFDDLIRRLKAIYADGVVTPDECDELAGMLRALVGQRVVEPKAPTLMEGIPSPTLLIFDDPAPQVAFQDREFCVTGTFAFGKRGVIETTVETLGGKTVKAPTSDTHYVLVGSFVSHGWTHGNYGTKIERALSLRKSGKPIAIIGEEHWKTFLT